MRLCLAWACLAAATLTAQTSESIPFRALLSPRNLLPPQPNLAADGRATIWLHLVRNADGSINSASVDFHARYAFGQSTTLTALHIHQGNATQAGPVVIDAGLPRTADATSGVIRLQAQSVNAAMLRNLLNNPANFYADIHTTANPGGAIRAQLLPAEHFVYLARLSPRNEVPAIPDLAAEGQAAISIIGTRDRQGRLTSAEVQFQVTHAGFPASERFTGLHVHTGAAGVNGPVVINSGLPTGVPVETALDFSVEAPLAPVAAIYDNAPQLYVNLHTATHPGGAIRGQLHRADASHFRFLLDTTPSSFTTYSLRDETGQPTAGFVIADLNFRFAGETTLSPPSLDDGAGRATELSANTLRSTTGRGNLFLSKFLPTGGILTQPDQHVLTLNGLRARLAALNPDPPRFTTTISAVWDPSQVAVARGGLFTVFGHNLAKATGGTTGLVAARLPLALNGTSVTIGGRPAPVLQINTDAVVAQVPNDVALGRQPVVITTPQGTTEGNAMVTANAPAVFFDDITRDGNRAAVFRVANGIYTQITSATPARPGDTLLLYGTGFGFMGNAMTPTGVIPTGITNAPRPAITVGGRAASVLHSVVPIGLPGMNQVAFVMPSAAGSGPVPLVIRIGTAVANRVYLDAAMR